MHAETEGVLVLVLMHPPSLIWQVGVDVFPEAEGEDAKGEQQTSGITSSLASPMHSTVRGGSTCQLGPLESALPKMIICIGMKASPSRATPCLLVKT